jgi:serine/threonine-protein kinase
MATPNTSQSSVLVPGQVVNGCRVKHRIGKGGMGIVYLAEHLHLRTSYAIKTISTDLCTPWQVSYFIKEARAAAKIKHSNVVTIHDAGEENGIHFIRMEYVDGKNLAELLHDRNCPLDWRDAVRLVRFAAKGLNAVHKQGIIHRDIKPSNIMLASDPARVILMDFGLAREENPSESTQLVFFGGTPEYMSPEQWENAKLKPRSDIYSLGVTLYTLLTGRPPFDRDEVKHAVATRRRCPPIQDLNRRVPQSVVDTVNKAMSYDANYRYVDSAAFARELGTLLKTSRDDVAPNWDTSSYSEFTEETIPTPAVPPLVSLEPISELASLGDDSDGWKTLIRWPVAVGGILSLAVVGFVLMINGSGRAPTIHNGMVHIPAGIVNLGIDEESAKKHFLSIPSITSFEITQDQSPPKEIPAFWIDQYEVTNAQYAAFLKATDHRQPNHWSTSDPPPGTENRPVENVEYADAAAYAIWAGKNLPTAEQWLRAFRGNHNWLFPWGNEYDARRANVHDNKDIPIARTTPVTATPRDVSEFKVYNLVGNVREFVRDKPFELFHETRGASYNSDGAILGMPTFLFRTKDLQFKEAGVGFRCVIEEKLP